MCHIYLSFAIYRQQEINKKRDEVEKVNEVNRANQAKVKDE